MKLRRATAARATLADDDARATVLDEMGPLPADAARWLASLCLLEGLPFRHLVPDTRMLPTESIRFFFVDQNWLDALVDGALAAVEVGGGLEAAVGRLARPGAAATVRTAAARRRAELRGRPAAAPAATERWSGCLLRSAAVADWPGLQVTAHDAAKAPLTALRIERVAPTVLLALFDGVAACLDVTEPHQALHFGIEDGGVELRGIGGAYAVATQLGVNATVTYRAGTRVLDISALVADITSQITTEYAGRPFPAIGPGAIGLQLLAVPESQPFVVPGQDSP